MGKLILRKLISRKTMIVATYLASVGALTIPFSNCSQPVGITVTEQRSFSDTTILPVSGPTATPTDLPSPVPSETTTPEPLPTSTPSPSPTVTPSPTATATPTPSPTTTSDVPSEDKIKNPSISSSNGELPFKLTANKMIELGQANQNISVTNSFSDVARNRFITGYTAANLVKCNGVSSGMSGGCIEGSAAYGNLDYFISKYDQSGNFKWTNQLGQAGKETYAYAIVTDGAGDVYVAGKTNGNLTSCSITNYKSCSNSTPIGQYDYFISKHSGTNGALIWTVRRGQSGKFTSASGLAFNSNGDLIVNGLTSGVLNCTSTSCPEASTATGSPTGKMDIFFAKHTVSGTTATSAYAKISQQFGVKDSTPLLGGMTIDTENNILFNGSTASDFATCFSKVTAACASSKGVYDLFLAKVSSSFSVMWVKQLGQSSKSTYGTDIAVAPANNDVFVSGYTNGNLTTCKGISANCSGNSTGGNDQIVLKYDKDGNFKWLHQLGGQTSTTSMANGIAVDPKTSFVFATGQTTGNLASCKGNSAACDPTLKSSGGSDVTVTKLDSLGNWMASLQLGSSFGSSRLATGGISVSVDADSKVVVAGYTLTDLTSCKDLQASACTGASAGKNDYFIMSLDQK